MQETQVQSLVWEDLLEKGMAIHTSILAWRIPWTEEPGGLQSLGLQRVGHDWATNIFTFKLALKQVPKVFFGQETQEKEKTYENKPRTLKIMAIGTYI